VSTYMQRASVVPTGCECQTIPASPSSLH
jgi:hypothetical protein